MKKTLSLAVVVTALIFIAKPATAQTVIAGTSFELATSVDMVQYTDTGNPAVNHALANNAGQPQLNFVASGGEIGYTSYYWNTRNDEGLTDGDWVGPTTYTGDVVSWPDGVQGIQISDADGKMTITMDTLDISGVTDPKISLEWFLNDGGWEVEDVVRIWVSVEPGSTEIDILNTAGFDIDDMAIVGDWWFSQVDLTGFTSVTLAFENDSNSSYESLFVDNVQLTGVGTVVDDIFLDGFESGSTTQWSSTVGGP